jgi:hypothetical protein
VPGGQAGSDFPLQLLMRVIGIKAGVQLPRHECDVLAMTVAEGNDMSVRANQRGIGSKQVVRCAILLHDHNHMLNRCIKRPRVVRASPEQTQTLLDSSVLFSVREFRQETSRFLLRHFSRSFAGSSVPSFR